MTSRADIDDFLQQRRIAMVGVSRHQKDFSRVLFREFVKRDYDIVPVNPAVSEVEGKRCFSRVLEITPAPEAVLLMTPPQLSDKVVRECAATGVHRVWMYRSAGQGAVSSDALEFCRQNGIRVVEGHCPFMFLPGTGFLPHGLHGFILKLTGRYPAAPHA